MITAKSFQSKVTKGKVSVRVDLSDELKGLSSKQRAELKKIVGQTLIDQVKDSTLDATSTVNQRGGNVFKELSPSYKKRKVDQGKGGKPNLRLSEDMINDLFSKNYDEGVELKITDTLSKKKAENHNHGVTVPKRQYLPTKDGQGFRREIMKVVNSKVRDYKNSIDSTDEK